MDWKGPGRRLGDGGSEMNRRQTPSRVRLTQLFMPVPTVPGPTQTVHGNPDKVGSTVGTSQTNAVDGLDHPGYTVHSPRTRFGHQEHRVNGEQSVDGKQAQRGRAVNEDQVMAGPDPASESQGQPVLSSQRVGGQLRLAYGQIRRRGH